MKLEYQVCGLDHSKRLKELGVAQDSMCFYYQQKTPNNPNLHEYGIPQQRMKWHLTPLGICYPGYFEGEKIGEVKPMRDTGSPSPGTAKYNIDRDGEPLVGEIRIYDGDNLDTSGVLRVIIDGKDMRLFESMEAADSFYFNPTGYITIEGNDTLEIVKPYNIHPLDCFDEGKDISDLLNGYISGDSLHFNNHCDTLKPL